MFLERSYILMLSNRFRNFKQTNDQFNFSCPYCGDSTRNKFKARGYMIQSKGQWYFYCHNCSTTRSFKNFLGEQDSELFKKYMLEKMAEQGNLEQSENISTHYEQKTSISFPDYKRAGSPLRKLKKVSQLSWDHPVKQYIQDRCIPNKYHAKLFYCPKFFQWTNSMVPGKFREEGKDEPRLIIPFVDEYGKFFGYQGRSLSAKSTLRYITIMFDEDRAKLYGLDDIDASKPIYVTEGPIDSMFIDNSLAMSGSDYSQSFTIRGKHVSNDKIVMVYDNEPRNEAIVNKMTKSAEMGRKIFMWPSTVEEKDINDVVMAGKSLADVKLLIESNIVSGLEAKMRIAVWKRC